MQWLLCLKQKISRNGQGIFQNGANDRERWGLLIYCYQNNIWCLIMPTQPTLRPTNTYTHTNKKDTVCLMTSAHSTSSPHNLFSNSHHDECTSFLITQLPKNKRKFIPKVLKVHKNQIQLYLYSASKQELNANLSHNMNELARRALWFCVWIVFALPHKNVSRAFTSVSSAKL